ncbi:restriction endonuclease subunit S [Maribacter sp. PR1]|uniref:Restriction endonuclease subunit S n=1 Tax=Maribacter cobaltidurans TaxID=1178778 RepID=A0ABU7IPP0_9FLAO|nr:MULTISPECIES: restriction endonuclease subunit S [Maribacter]MDC6387533.1 restriction endonuclease subunit S [Maribacter sp. PR1]MEE1974920.1 restriction endonuclease subunit S [Maribacter cobaltidurans]
MMEKLKPFGYDDIPDDWTLKSLGDISASNHQGINTVAEKVKYVNDGYPILQAKHITSEKIQLNDTKYVDDDDWCKYKNKYQPKYGEILLSNIGTIGRTVLIEKEIDLLIAWNIFLIRPIQSLAFPPFVREALRFLYSNKYLDRLTSGNATKFVNKSQVESTPILLPPLAEQQKIAEILSTVDAKIDVIDQQISETQELKKGLMQRLMTKGIGHTEFKDSSLGEIPKSWKVVKIQDLLNEGRIISHLDGNHGGLYPKADEFIDDGVPYISANCFINSKVDFSKCKHLSMERSLQFRKGVAKNGDVLFAHNATVGPVAFLETDLDFVILSTTATYFRLDNKTIDAKYWLFFLSSPTFKNQYEKVMGQSTRNQVPITMQRSFLSVLPTFQEQKEISEILNTTDKKLEVLSEKKTNYVELKQGLMQQLLTGKVRVQLNSSVTS